MPIVSGGTLAFFGTQFTYVTNVKWFFKQIKRYVSSNLHPWSATLYYLGMCLLGDICELWIAVHKNPIIFKY